MNSGLPGAILPLGYLLTLRKVTPEPVNEIYISHSIETFFICIT